MRRVFSVNYSTVLAASVMARYQSTEGKKVVPPQDAKKRAELYKKMQKTLEENKAAYEEKKKEALYIAAEADNTRKKYREQIAEAKNQAVLTFGKDLLEISDALTKVCNDVSAYRKSHEELSPKVKSLFSGVELSLKVVDGVLARFGLKKVNIEVGSKFDPDISVHTFTAPATAEIPAGHVVQVVKGAYKFNDQIVRHGEVGIAEESEKEVSTP